MQQGLEQWLSFLSGKSLPVLKRTKTDVQALIDQTQLSITQYSGPIVYDAGFSAQIFCHVNTQREKSGKNPLTTMGNALSHLGQAAFQSFLNETPLLENLNLSDKNSQGYMRVLGLACHASLQAKEWAQQRNVAETEETQLATLLQSITELLLWCYGDDVMPKIEELCYVKKQNYEQAAKAVLGCGMRELGAKLSAAWNLPEMATLGLTTRQDDFTLATGVSLSSEMSRIVALNWYGKDATEIIKRIAKYKGRAEGEIERRLHLNAVNVNDTLIGKGYAAPAKLLFQLADDKYKYPQFILSNEEQNKNNHEQADEIKSVINKTHSKDKIKTENEVKKKVKRADVGKDNVKSIDKPEIKTSAARDVILEKIKARKVAAEQEEKTRISSREIEKSPSDLPVNKLKPVEVKKVKSGSIPENKKTAAISKDLAASIKCFQEMVAQAKPAHDLIEYAVKTCLLCGVQRCVFAIKLPGKEMMVSRYSAQVSDDLAINNFKIPINKPHVFKLLMEKSRNLFLNESNAGKYWNFIPETVKLAIGVRSFFAMSIFVNNHAMGLMYADKVKGELTQAEFSQFQGVCRLLAKGIMQSAKNKSDKN
ncbi:MAG: hypothetical protein DIZ80_15920 [endosymbiont of Galathealinum brachiosum]|uniref:HDOD domain-containing protein n=1 Tax=endosymbiont of Galathealinum brachiosum TaxID=2200906 RepID=A0A370D9H7_9GAMM|nr:MAG: hypothetical protein DIZ80_15920 [endosymbiont of Galathealinum brachiosum]